MYASDPAEIAELLGKARDAEERYRTLFASANDAIAVLTLDGVIVECNRRWGVLLGVDPATLVGRHIREFAGDGHEDANVRAFQQSLGSGSGRTAPVPLRRPDGATIYMTFSSTVLALDGRPQVFSIGHDVTAEVQAERSVAAAESRYRALIERMPDVVWTADHEGRITFVTPSVEAVCGYRADELQAGGCELWFTRMHADDRATARAAYQGMLDGASPSVLEYRWQHRDGRWLWLRDRPISAYQQDGVTYVDGMLADVTERRRLEESLQQAQKMEAIGRLTGGIAHDFNNMLAAILTNARFLQESLATDDPRRADAVDIEQAGERAAELTRQLLAFGRRQVMAPIVIQLDTAMAGIESMLRRLIGADIAFRVSSQPRLGAIRVDVGQLEQVVVNLVVNARDAMPMGGSLTIDTANVEPGDDVAAGVPPGRYVALTVADTGCGMDAETRRRVFEPFFTTKGHGRGTGLGLSTCYGIVQQSGGHIAVHSELGQGTTVAVYLPRVDAAPVRPAELEPNARLGGTETVLIIEDDDRVRASVTRILKPCGYHLLVARDGADALAIIGAHTGAIDLVLSDVIMPGLNGPEVVALIHERFPQARAVFMSGYSDHVVLAKAGERGDLDFIQKPFATRALLAKLREVLDR